MLVLALAWFHLAGCEKVALVGRDSVKVEPAEILVEVERVDSRSKRIYLRPNSEGISVVSYDDSTRVIHRGRELSAEDLQAGDVVAMALKEKSAERYYYSDFLSIRERRDNRDTTR